MNPESDRNNAAAHDGPHSWLSALADGDAQAADRACGLWRDDPEARRSWHAYHLIGDVMRSEELAAPATRDAAFLSAVRARLATEPVLLAPAPALLAAAPRRQPWLVPTAVAAGFMVVAGGVVVTRMSPPGAQPASAVLAAASMPAQRATSDNQLVSSQGVISDPRLNELLRFHNAATSQVAVAAPGGALRRVDIVVPAAPDR